MNKNALRKLNKIRKILQPKRLKIAEQILIVLFIAVLIPMIISGIVINNINQQAMISQLRNSATLIANIVSDEVDVFVTTASNQMNLLEVTLKYLPSKEAKIQYLNNIKDSFQYYTGLTLVDTERDVQKIKEDNKVRDNFTMYLKTSDNKFIVASFKNEDLINHLFK